MGFLFALSLIDPADSIESNGNSQMNHTCARCHWLCQCSFPEPVACYGPSFQSPSSVQPTAVGRLKLYFLESFAVPPGQRSPPRTFLWLMRANLARRN